MQSRGSVSKASDPFQFLSRLGLLRFSLSSTLLGGTATKIVSAELSISKIQLKIVDEDVKVYRISSISVLGFDSTALVTGERYLCTRKQCDQA